MQCNIDRRGRQIRFIGGWICCAAGSAALVAAFAGAFQVGWLIAGLSMLISGLFQLFQARKGWCALRAMGVKVPF